MTVSRQEVHPTQLSPSTNGAPHAVSWKLHHDNLGRLVWTGEEGREHTGAEVVRAFPLSMPRHGVSIVDAEGKELVWIEDLDELPPGVRKTLEEHLAQREFIPVILSVLRVSAAVEPSEWEVETDRGRTRFLLKSEDDVHRLDEVTALITDAHGVRYLIPDTRRLDSTSRRRLERFL